MPDPQTARDAVWKIVARGPLRDLSEARAVADAVLSALGIPPDTPLPLRLRDPEHDGQVVADTANALMAAGWRGSNAPRRPFTEAQVVAAAQAIIDSFPAYALGDGDGPSFEDWAEDAARAALAAAEEANDA